MAPDLRDGNGDGDGDPLTPGPKDPGENYIQQQRLDDIFEARRKARDWKIEARKHQLSRGDEFTGLSLYREAVESYVSEAEDLRSHYPQIAPQYWEQMELGEVVLSPDLDDNEQLPPSHVQNSPIGAEGGTFETATIAEGASLKPLETTQPDANTEPVTYEVVGINSILTLPNPLTAEFTVESERRLSANDRETRTVTQQIPFGVLDNIRRCTNLFLSEVGITTEPDETSKEWDI